MPLSCRRKCRARGPIFPSPNVTVRPACVSEPKCATPAAVPVPKNSTASSHTSSTDTRRSSTVMPSSSARVITDWRVMPGRMVSPREGVTRVPPVSTANRLQEEPSSRYRCSAESRKIASMQPAASASFLASALVT